MVENKHDDTNETNETKNSGIVVLILLLFFAITGSWLYIARKKKKSVLNRSQAKVNNVGQGTDQNFFANYKGKLVPVTVSPSKSENTKVSVDDYFYSQDNKGKLVPATVSPYKAENTKVSVDDYYYSQDNPNYHPDDQYLVQARKKLL